MIWKTPWNQSVLPVDPVIGHISSKESADDPLIKSQLPTSDCQSLKVYQHWMADVSNGRWRDWTAITQCWGSLNSRPPEPQPDASYSVSSNILNSSVFMVSFIAVSQRLQRLNATYWVTSSYLLSTVLLLIEYLHATFWVPSTNSPAWLS